MPWLSLGLCFIATVRGTVRGIDPSVYDNSMEYSEHMEENTDNLLAEFARQVREQIDKVNAAKGKQAEQLQTALSKFITEQVQALVKQGLPVMKIQETLRAATDMVPQTYAPDDTGDDSGEALEPPVGSITFFLPMDESIINAFTAGKLGKAELMDLLGSSPDITPIEMSGGLDLVLTDYGKNMALDDATGGGEIVAGPDGEAFIPENLDIRNTEGDCGAVREPMVFKTAPEVKSIEALLEPITEYVFRKKADIKKLLKAGWLDEYDKRSVKKEAGYIIGVLWDECAALREVYRKAAEQQKGMVVFMGYEGN